MRVGIITAIIGLMIFGGNNVFANSSKNQEKNHYLGVLNGQVEGNSVVKVNRTLTNSVIYDFSSEEKLPNNLIVKDATVRGGNNGSVFVTAKQILPDSKGEAFITLNVAMLIDGKKTPFNFESRGEDAILNIPSNGGTLQLRSDSPVELTVPVNYRGNVRIEMEIEDEYVD
ncbi:DUF5462 family protein [Citrobacter sp. S-77]|uniref:DUF5462 family protein n=1 Tax=Citrobacter sp. S-77 TaxID=1080067 RepID=UPI000695075B|nr:DUF5462 family protein [Citrobacter sp. S-77]